jgi:hypothetical protein
VDLDAVLKSFSTERTGEIGGVIDEKHSIGDVVLIRLLSDCWWFRY